MAVKIGSSYVSDAAYNFAVAQVAADDGNGNVLQELRGKFSGLNISVGTGPFSGTGTNNVSISPKILQEMQTDPAKKLQYEALLYDIAVHNPIHKSSNPTVKSSGMIIGDDGGLSSWSISQSNTRKTTPLNKDDKKSWWLELLDTLSEKAKAKKDEVEISEEGLAALNKQAEKDSDTDESANGRVAFNESKRARQLAAAQTRDEVQAVLELLKNDLEDCKEGLAREMCDESEVQKVEAMIERAKERLNEVGDEPVSPHMSPLDILI